MTKLPTAPPSDDPVYCQRSGVLKTTDEHRACPYCFGKAAQVHSGDRRSFCDYDAEKDPPVFGFPEGSSRLR